MARTSPSNHLRGHCKSKSSSCERSHYEVAIVYKELYIHSIGKMRSQHSRGHSLSRSTLSISHSKVNKTPPIPSTPGTMIASTLHFLSQTLTSALASRERRSPSIISHDGPLGLTLVKEAQARHFHLMSAHRDHGGESEWGRKVGEAAHLYFRFVKREE